MYRGWVAHVLQRVREGHPHALDGQVRLLRAAPGEQQPLGRLRAGVVAGHRGRGLQLLQDVQGHQGRHSVRGRGRLVQAEALVDRAHWLHSLRAVRLGDTEGADRGEV